MGEGPQMSREDAILERMAGRHVEIPDETPTDSGEEARENLGELADEQADAADGHGGQTLEDGSTPTLGEGQVADGLDLSEGDATPGEGGASDVTPGDTPEAVGVEAAKQTGATTGEPLPESEGGDANGLAPTAEGFGDDEDAAGDDAGAGDEEE